jgi:pSer/pThr/pTyr-binding forkhead associated (FHA) protein
MSPRITLTATEGSLIGQEFVFPIRMAALVGRADDCLIRIRDGSDLTVSRRHCLLDIDPPVVRVRDLGSRNGTFVNGQKIGQRDKGTPPYEVSPPELKAVELHDGDQLAVGGCEFLVRIQDGTELVPEEVISPQEAAQAAGLTVGR